MKNFIFEKYRKISIFGKRIINDFSNMNLSNMDFSKYPASFWKDAIFYDTNLKNSKINFNPQNLPHDYKILRGINFENVDLSYLKNNDFNNVTVDHCNFYNTGLSIDFNRIPNPSKTLYDVKLDEKMTIGKRMKVNINTIKLNPKQNFTDKQILMAIIKNMNEKYKDFSEFSLCDKHLNSEDYTEKCTKYINEIILYLKEFNRPILVNLISKMIKSQSINTIWYFLTYYNSEHDIIFENLILNEDEVSFIRDCGILVRRKVKFNNCIFDTSYIGLKSLIDKKLNSVQIDYLFKKNKLEFNNCSILKNNYKNFQLKRLYKTPFACNSSVFIDFNLNEQPNYKRINDLICDKDFYSHLNQIYFNIENSINFSIEDIIYNYYNCVKKAKLELSDLYFLTNGQIDWERISTFLKKIEELYIKSYIIINRQEIKDSENEKLIGSKNYLDDKDLKNLLEQNKILFKLTLDRLNMRGNFLKDYFQFGNEIGVKRFIIQNPYFEEENLFIDSIYIDEYFKEFEEYLLGQGYNFKKIVSTSYFDLNLYKKDDYSVSIKRHFNPIDLNKHLAYCPKHSFDLGIDSNGKMYDDYQNKKILIK